jgi:hypothetical protein
MPVANEQKIRSDQCVQIDARLKVSEWFPTFQRKPTHFYYDRRSPKSSDLIRGYRVSTKMRHSTNKHEI